MKKGISLIVLVITIIIMIILAATIVISLNNSNVISSANKAVEDTNLATVKTQAELAWSDWYTSKTKEDPNVPADEYVEQVLTEAGIDINKYIVTADDDGVSVRRIATFTLSNNYYGTFTYQYEEGMTWAEFINSDYNENKATANGYILLEKSSSNEYVMHVEHVGAAGSGAYLYSDSGRNYMVKISDVINQNEYFMDEVD